LALIVSLLSRFFTDRDQVSTISESSEATGNAFDIQAIERRSAPARGKAKRPAAKGKSTPAVKSKPAAKSKPLSKQPAQPAVPPKKREPHRYILPRPAAKGSSKRGKTARSSGGLRSKGKTPAQPGGKPHVQLPPILFAGRSPVRAAAVHWPKLILASCHRDDLVSLWDLRYRDRRLREIKSDAGAPIDLAFHPSGGPIAVVTSRKVTFYSVPELENIGSLESSGELSSCAFSSNGAYLAVAQTEGGVVIRVLSTFGIVGRLPAYGGTQHVAWSPNGGELLVASADNAVRLWHPDRLDTPIALAGHLDWISCSAAATNVQRVVTGSWDFSARAWNLNTRQCTAVFPAHRARVAATAITSDGKLAASGDEEGVIRIWDPSTGAEACALRGHGGPITALAFHDKSLILSTSQDGSARTWQITERLQWPSGDLTTRKTSKEPRASLYATALAEACRLARRGDRAKAIAQARQAAALRADYVEAHLALAEQHREAGQQREAISSYKDALKLRPQSGWLWYRLGSLLLKVEQTELAVGALEQACASLPDLLAARLTLGKGLIVAQRYEDAKRAFEVALTAQPNSPDTHDGLGQSYAGLANWQKAIEHYRRAIDIKREYAPAYSHLVDAHLAAGPEHTSDAQNWAQLARNLGIELRPDTKERLERASGGPQG